ncbi:MAG: hypothetical protein K6F84_08375 [Lachnospiraceae bacterium]|nr:hypothetical protein [Lachnospiraceae bacterium]
MIKMLSNSVAVTKVRNFLNKKVAGVDGLVVALVLIVVAVVVGLIFKDQISTLVTSLISTVKTKISGMF